MRRGVGGRRERVHGGGETGRCSRRKAEEGVEDRCRGRYLPLCFEDCPLVGPVPPLRLVNFILGVASRSEEVDELEEDELDVEELETDTSGWWELRVWVVVGGVGGSVVVKLTLPNVDLGGESVTLSFSSDLSSRRLCSGEGSRVGCADVFCDLDPLEGPRGRPL